LSLAALTFKVTQQRYICIKELYKVGLVVKSRGCGFEYFPLTKKTNKLTTNICRLRKKTLHLRKEAKEIKEAFP